MKLGGSEKVSCAQVRSGLMEHNARFRHRRLARLPFMFKEKIVCMHYRLSLHITFQQWVDRHITVVLFAFCSFLKGFIVADPNLLHLSNEKQVW